jgi:hypothetical protein
MASTEDRVGSLETSVAQLAVAVKDIQPTMAELAKMVADSASGTSDGRRPPPQRRQEGRDEEAGDVERGSHRGGPHAPRYGLSLFDGAEDPLLWLRQCER